MGLRFRRSITLCKGVKLNVGKTGVSISAGIPGFRKTIHSSGRVTTSVGIPGSGLYYVDTDYIGKKKKQQPQNQCNSVPMQQLLSAQPAMSTESAPTSANSFTPTNNSRSSAGLLLEERTLVHYPVDAPAVDTPPAVIEQEIPIVPELPHQPSFRDLFENCDLPVNWIDVLSNREPVDDSYDVDTWKYLHSKAVTVFEGNSEVMLQIIDEIGPFDDLSPYVSSFSVEMENPTELGIEFSVDKDIAPRNELQDAVCSVLIRAVRDAFALLPVERVTIHTLLEGNVIISAHLNRASFASSEFEGKDPSDILESFEVNMKYSPLFGFQSVQRFK